MDLEALGRLGLLGPRGVGRTYVPDAVGTEGVGQGGRLQDGHDGLSEPINGPAGDVQVEVFGAADAAEKEAQVDSAFEGIGLRVELPPQPAEEFEMEHFPVLQGVQNALEHICILVKLYLNCNTY